MYSVLAHMNGWVMAKYYLYIQSSSCRLYYVRLRCDCSMISYEHCRQTTSPIRSPQYELSVATRRSLVDPAGAWSNSRPTLTSRETAGLAATDARRAAGRDAGTRGTRRRSACRRCSRGSGTTTMCDDDGVQATLTEECACRCRRCRTDEVAANDSTLFSLVDWQRRWLLLLGMMVMTSLSVPHWCCRTPGKSRYTHC